MLWLSALGLATLSKGQPLLSQSEEPTVSQTSRLLASLVLKSKQLLGAPLPDEEDMSHDNIDTFKPCSTTSSDTDILSLIYLSGDEDLQSRLRTLCKVMNLKYLVSWTLHKVTIKLL